MTYLLRHLQKPLVLVTIIGVIFATIGVFNMTIMTAHAATLTAFRFELGSSKPNTATNISVNMTNATVLNGDATASDDDAKIVIRFPDSTAANTFFTLGAIDTNSAGGFADTTITGFPAGITINSIALSDRGTTNQNDTITIGLNQTDGVPAAINISAGTQNLVVNFLNNKITTPTKVSAAGTADIHQMSIATQANTGGTYADTDTAGSQVAIIEAQSGSATVNTTLSLVEAALTSGSVNGTAITETDATATTIPFGTLAPKTAKTRAHRLTIATNAPGGYNLYVVQDKNLSNAGNVNDIDQFQDGTAKVPSNDVAWASPGVIASSEATYGHLGYTTSDVQVFDVANTFGAVPTRVDASAPITTGIACNNTAATSSDTCDILYKVEISALQEAGSYTNEITYVVVPLY